VADPTAPSYLGELSVLAAKSFASTSEAIDAILILVSHQLGMRSSFLAHVDRDHERVEVVDAHNAPVGRAIERGEAPPLPAHYCRVIAGSVEPLPLLIHDVESEAALDSHPAWSVVPNLRSFIGVPVVLSDGSFYGTLCAVDPESRELTSSQGDLLIVLARLVAMHLERDRVEAELRVRDHAIAASTSGILITDATAPDHPIVYVNPSFESMTGYTAAEVLGRNCRFLQGDDREQPEIDQIRAAVAAGWDCLVELRNYRKDGVMFYNELRMAPVRDGDGRVTAFVGVQTDITERKELEKRLADERFRSLVHHASDIVMIIDTAGTTTYVSPSVEKIMGRTSDGLVGQKVLGADHIHPDDVARVLGLFEELMTRPGSTMTAEMQARHADGTWKHLEVVATNLLADRAVGGIVVNYRDITERKQYEEQLRHQAFHDPLTGLPNRALLINRLERALARAARRGETVAVLYLDLDHFKLVNDTLGHEAGDHLLTEVGRRVRICLRPEDTPARLSGDEFAVLLEDITDEEDAGAIAERIADQLRTPFDIGGREVAITSSLGIAVSGPGRTTPEDLMRSADAAMYRAKRGGRSRFEVYDPEMDRMSLERAQLESDLRGAVERGEFRLHYQPIVNFRSERVLGVEALIRWDHPTRGLLPPSAFISIAEETGLILSIERWLLKEACRQAREWQIRYPSDDSISVSVNLAALELGHPDLVTNVSEILDATGLPPHNLVLEITESTVMVDAEATIVTLEELRGLGVRIAVDDFGIGYSSLAYLHRFPIDILKIDQSFVGRLGMASESIAIVRAVLALAEALNLRVIAEGIESHAHLQHLLTLGCELGQGYLFARPLPPSSIEEMLQKAEHDATSNHQ